MTPADTFRAAHTSACTTLTALYGHQWWQDTSLYHLGRTKPGLVSIQVLGKPRAGRRDLRIPLAKYWPDHTIPNGVTLSDHATHEAPLSLIPLDHPAMFGRTQHDPFTRDIHWCHVPATHPARTGAVSPITLAKQITADMERRGVWPPKASRKRAVPSDIVPGYGFSVAA